LPEKFKFAVVNKFDPKIDHNSKAAELAKTLATHLAKDYLYSTGARPEVDPITALQAGHFSVTWQHIL